MRSYSAMATARANLVRVPITLDATLNWLLSILSNKIACFPSNLLTTAASSNLLLTDLLIRTSSLFCSKRDKNERKSFGMLLGSAGFCGIDLFVVIVTAFDIYELHDLIHNGFHVLKLQLFRAMERSQANAVDHRRNSLRNRVHKHGIMFAWNYFGS